MAKAILITSRKLCGYPRMEHYPSKYSAMQQIFITAPYKIKQLWTANKMTAKRRLYVNTNSEILQKTLI